MFLKQVLAALGWQEIAVIWRLHGLLWNRNGASDGPDSTNTGITFSQSLCLHVKSAVEEFKQRHKIRQVFNRFVIILSPLFQRAWYSVLQCNFNASCLICKAGELFSWGKMCNIDCMQLAAFPEFWTGEGHRSARFSISLSGAWECWSSGCWRQLSITQSPSGRTAWKKLLSLIKSPVQ